MKQIEQSKIVVTTFPCISTLENAEMENESATGPGLENIDVPGLDIGVVLKMLPQSDEEHYVGSEYFVG